MGRFIVLLFVLSMSVHICAWLLCRPCLFLSSVLTSLSFMFCVGVFFWWVEDFNWSGWRRTTPAMQTCNMKGRKVNADDRKRQGQSKRPNTNMDSHRQDNFTQSTFGWPHFLNNLFHNTYEVNLFFIFVINRCLFGYFCDVCVAELGSQPNCHSCDQVHL